MVPAGMGRSGGQSVGSVAAGAGDRPAELPRRPWSGAELGAGGRAGPLGPAEVRTCVAGALGRAVCCDAHPEVSVVAATKAASNVSGSLIWSISGSFLSKLVGERA